MVLDILRDRIYVSCIFSFAKKPYEMGCYRNRELIGRYFTIINFKLLYIFGIEVSTKCYA